MALSRRSLSRPVTSEGQRKFGAMITVMGQDANRLEVLSSFTSSTDISLECVGLLLQALASNESLSARHMMRRFELGREMFRRIVNEAIDAGFAIPDGIDVLVTDERHTITSRSRRISNVCSVKAAISDELRWAVWERDDFRCLHCGARRFLTVDHVTPESRGGTLALDNLQTLCRSCNSRKGAR